MVTREPQRLFEWLAAVTVAMLVMVAVLLAADRLARLAGEQMLLAFERLTGLVLTAIAVEMLVTGIRAFAVQI
jgi:small neutral amino acid transporter SnatA (MarC family)